MKRVFPGLAAVALPFAVFAIAYENLSLLYTDAPFLPAEAAAVSVLTKLGAVQGNPDGSFRPNRLLNRAEFLKIAIASNPRIRVAKSDAADCFPDVRKSDWFAPAVCLAKKRGVVSGYPDGTFRPGRDVNYAEALKILGELYGYLGYAASDEPWYMGYVRQAQFHRTLLPMTLPYDRPLTRGQMARLAAAYRAEEEGELDLYRLAERDIGAAMVAQRKEAGEEKEAKEAEELRNQKGSSSSASYSSSDSSASFSSLPPVTSHLLLLGSERVPIAEALFYPRQGEDAEVRIFQVIFDEEIDVLGSLVLLREDGTEIGDLVLDVHDTDDKTWILTAERGSGALLPGGEGTRLVVVATVRGRGAGGFAEMLFKVKKFRMVAGNPVSFDTYDVIPAGALYPEHQTVQGTVAQVTNTLKREDALAEGERRLIAEFAFEAEALPGTAVTVEHLSFAIEAEGVTVTNWTLGSLRDPVRRGCSIQSAEVVNCTGIPLEYGLIEDEPLRLRLFGDVTFTEGAPERRLQATLLSPGAIGTLGAVRWTDGSGHYTWIEGEEPVAEGTIWK